AAAARAMPQYPIREVDGSDWVALRIGVPADVPYSAAGIGPNWTVILGPGALAANVAGATKVLWLDDPVVGDRLAVATALAPAKGVILKRQYVDLAVLPSAQGLALMPMGESLQVTTDGDVLRITRPDG